MILLLMLKVNDVTLHIHRAVKIRSKKRKRIQNLLHNLNIVKSFIVFYAKDRLIVMVRAYIYVGENTEEWDSNLNYFISYNYTLLCLFRLLTIALLIFKFRFASCYRSPKEIIMFMYIIQHAGTNVWNWSTTFISPQSSVISETQQQLKKQQIKKKYSIEMDERSSNLFAFLCPSGSRSTDKSSIFKFRLPLDTPTSKSKH